MEMSAKSANLIIASSRAYKVIGIIGLGRLTMHDCRPISHASGKGALWKLVQPSMRLRISKLKNIPLAKQASGWVGFAEPYSKHSKVLRNEGA